MERAVAQRFSRRGGLHAFHPSMHPLSPPPHPPRPSCSSPSPNRERKNVNLPGVVVDLPTLTDKDIDDLVGGGCFWG